MNRTQIEWVKNPDGTQGYTRNPITGCLNHVNGLCKGGGFPCYAYKLAHGRLRQRYLANHNISDKGFSIIGNKPVTLAGCGHLYEQQLNDPFYPRFWEERLDELNPCAKTKLFTVGGGSKVQPKGIFVCDMGDLFGEGIPYKWTVMVLDVIKFNPNHRFYLLTKQPQNLIKFSPFPENCWVGVTATKWLAFSNALGYLATIKAKVKFLSFEPLLERIQLDMLQKMLFPSVIDWLIIGACTGTKAEMTELVRKYPELTLMPLCLDVDRRNRYIVKWTAQPPISWLKETVEAADKAGIPVFLKDNLKPLFKPNYEVEYPWAYKWGEFRQEMPSNE